MNWLRRNSTAGARDVHVKSASPSPLRTTPQRGMSGSDVTSHPGTPSSSMTSTPRMVPGSTGILKDRPSPRASPIARRHLRMDTDPATCLEVFKTHWCQAKTVMTHTDMSTSVKQYTLEDVEAVIRYVDQMALLLVEEDSQDGGQGHVLEYLLTEDILNKLLSWSSQCPEYSDQLKLHQLKMYDLLISQSRQLLLVHKPVIRPLLKLLGLCREHPNPDIEHFLVLVLHQLCVCVIQYKHLLELLFDASPDHGGSARFLVFSLLITYIHRQGDVGQQARDALLLIMSLSSVHDSIGQYIADLSDFCPVLATGLSGLYSSLPRKLDYPSDDWYRITTDDIMHMPDLVMFLNSLDFCNAVVQVAHPLVRDQLLLYIYNGFLLPVLGPALHQNEITYSESEDDFALFMDDDDDLSSMEEVIAASAYLDLFLRRITEPTLIRTFLKFILTAQHDDVNILDSLITRINSNSRLCMVTLSLFRTLVDLNCEDVMFQLVFKYLIPCTHVMVSQRRAVKDVDLYSKTAEKLLSLRPTCCLTEPDPTDTPNTLAPDSVSLNSSSPQSTPGSPIMLPASRQMPASTPTHGKKFKQFLLRRGPSFFNDFTTSSATNTPPPRSSSPDIPGSAVNHSLDGSSSTAHHTPRGSTSISPDQLDITYLDYLKAMRTEIEQCNEACQCWSLPYDGENPPIDSLVDGSLVIKQSHQVLPNGASVSSVLGKKSVITSASNDMGNMVNRSESSPGGIIHSHIHCDNKQPNNTDHTEPSNDLKQPGERSSYTDSVTSDVDSAFSTSGCPNTDQDDQTASTQQEDVVGNTEQSPTCRDSPLSDNFDNVDFGAFLLTLKRVKTPVELSGSIEESFSEIESIANKLKYVNVESKRLSVKSISSDHTVGSPLEASPNLPFPPHLTQDSIAKSGRLVNGEVRDDSSVPITAKIEDAAKFQSDTSKRSISPLLTPLKRSNSTSPSVGPFLTTLMARLDMMMQNTLYVNLLLTGLLTRLACYPQPLLRSFLLNHTLVFQPTVKSLIQVLGTVKQKVEVFALTVKNFEDMLLKARHFLQWREDMYLHSIGEPSNRRDSAASFPGALPPNRQVPEPQKRTTIKDMFRRNQNSRRGKSNPRLQLLSDKKGARYLNQKNSPGGTTSPEDMADQLEALKAKNAVYCAIVLDEVLKELSAISQEHAITCV